MIFYGSSGTIAVAAEYISPVMHILLFAPQDDVLQHKIVSGTWTAPLSGMTNKVASKTINSDISLSKFYDSYH